MIVCLRVKARSHLSLRCIKQRRLLFTSVGTKSSSAPQQLTKNCRVFAFASSCQRLRDDCERPSGDLRHAWNLPHLRSQEYFFLPRFPFTSSRSRGRILSLADSVIRRTITQVLRAWLQCETLFYRYSTFQAFEESDLHPCCEGAAEQKLWREGQQFCVGNADW